MKKDIEKLKKIEEDFSSFISKTKIGFTRPHVFMKDGIKMSVQASAYHYCIPRKSGLEDYECFEIGYPSEAIEQLKQYVECPVESDEEYKNSVYPYVPKEVIIDILYEHGGMDLEKMFDSDPGLKDLKNQKSEMNEKMKQIQDLFNQINALYGDIIGD